MAGQTELEKQWAQGIEALGRAVKIAGSQQIVADVIGCRQSAISECLRNGQKVPAEWCIPLEAATRAAGTEISRADLRADLFGPDVQPPAPLRAQGRSSDATRAVHVERDAVFPREKARARG